MLLANMLKNVCGCKVVEGQNSSRVPTPPPPASPPPPCAGLEGDTVFTDWPPGCMDCFKEGLQKYGIQGSEQAMSDCGYGMQ